MDIMMHPLEAKVTDWDRLDHWDPTIVTISMAVPRCPKRYMVYPLRSQLSF